MSTGGNLSAQPAYRDEARHPWNQERTDSLSHHASANASGFSHDNSLNAVHSSKGVQYGSSYPSRESLSGGSSLSPTTQSTSQLASNEQTQVVGISPALQDSYLHYRASISGPMMGAAQPYHGEGDAVLGHAPPRAHGLAAWESASGSARPHTADGMFGQFGFPDPSSAPPDSESASYLGGSMAAPRGYPSGPGPHSAAAMDPYAQQRRFSMPTSALAGDMGGNKIFSYMPPMEDGMPGPGGLSYGSGGYGGHKMGGLGGFGNGVGKKRPRRRYDEIERLYPCKWPGCAKSYGTLNHLNAHVAMQKHGPKRSPSEFKDMRKAWRRQKKEDEQRRQIRPTGYGEHGMTHVPMSAGYHHAGGPASGGGMHHGLSILPPATSGMGPMSQPSSSASGSFGAPYSAPLSMAAPSSRYSISSVASSSGSLPPSAYGQASFGNLSSLPLMLPGSDSSHPVSGGPTEGRPYTAGSSNQNGADAYPPGGLGAYLMAHRGSI